MEFEEDFVRRVKNGATAHDRKDWRHLPEISTFTDIRNQIDKNAKVESESSAHRNVPANHQSESAASLFLMQKQTLKLMQSMLSMNPALIMAKPTNNRSGNIYNDDPNKL
ncbi:hypothetical protein HDV05_008710 [Chytridiales sp. JEL 0842]|nr:hypothetical protein HDV05_008710 [Chytridiales sp. JEL 0842]